MEDQVIMEAESFLKRPGGEENNEADNNKKHQEEKNNSNEEKSGGGFLDNLISNLSPKTGGVDEEKTHFFHVKDREASENEVGDKENGKEEEQAVEGGGGGGIIDEIVSHFSLPEDAAPTTDEASILIHSIIHD